MKMAFKHVCALFAVVMSGTAAGQSAATIRHFEARNLEETSDRTANVSMGDLDGDGDLDLVLAKGRHQPQIDRVLLNDGRGGFTASDLGPTSDRSYAAVLADIDGDRDLDALVSNDKPDAKVVYLNDGKGRFRAAGTWGSPEWSTRNAAAADLNGDGRPDVIAANRPGPSSACLNDGRGGFASPCVEIPIGSATSIVPADFNGDGFVDLAAPYRDRGQSLIFINDGKANFAKTIPFGPADAAARVAAAADFDGNGSLDLAVADEAAASLAVYVNDGKGGLSRGFHTAAQRIPYAIAAGDLNRDRKPEIVLGYVRSRDRRQSATVFFNDGTGTTFTETHIGDGNGDAYGFAIGDVNADGYPDIALARDAAPSMLYVSVK
jgi:hypothetical protein